MKYKLLSLLMSVMLHLLNVLYACGISFDCRVPNNQHVLRLFSSLRFNNSALGEFGA